MTIPVSNIKCGKQFFLFEIFADTTFPKLRICSHSQHSAKKIQRSYGRISNIRTELLVWELRIGAKEKSLKFGQALSYLRYD